MSVLSPVFCAALILGFVLPASMPAQELRGTVVDVSTLQPIPGAQVFITPRPAAGSVVTGRDRLREAVTILTGASGKFVYTADGPAEVRVEARKDGYVGPGPEIKGFEPAAVAKLESGKTATVRLLMAQAGRITGRVVDSDTSRAAGGLSVVVYLAYYLRGKRTLFPAGRAKTDAAGRFEIGGLPPADYLIEIGPSQESAPAIAAPGAKQERQYSRVFFPGGGDAEVASPVRLVSGTYADLGRLDVRKTAVFRVRAEMQAIGCRAGEQAMVEVGPISQFAVTRGQEPCDRDFTIRGLPPGSYAMRLWILGRTSSQRAKARVTFDVVDRNITVAVPLTPGVDIAGRITAPNASALSKLSLSLRPVGGANFSDDPPTTVDSEGRFQICNVERREQELRFNGLPGPYYIAAMKYNGKKIDGRIFLVDPLAQEHSLEIVIRDDPATLYGAVQHDNQPAAGARLILVKWPVQDDLYRAVMTTQADAGGNFRFEALAPGEYRVAAVSATAAGTLDEPGRLQSWIDSSDAQSVVLSANAVRSLALDLAAR